MRRVRLAALVVGLCVPAAQAPAQFWDKMTNPKINAPIRHPPGLGLQVNKVAFGPATGEAAQQFIEALTEQFLKANIEVMERQQIETMLAEQNFSLSGYVDNASAVEMGRILGPAVLLFVNVPRHHAEQKKLYERWKDGKGFPHVTHISKTVAHARGSVRAVDLATGRVFASKSLEASPELKNTLQDECCPEFPDQEEALDLAMRQIVGQAQRLFLPWVEQTELYFFDDKDCNLKAAHALMKSGNVEAALQQSLTNLESCKTNPKAKEKHFIHANHNVGMGYFAMGQFDKSLEYLNAAQQIKVTDITTEAIGECIRARNLATEMQRVEERMALEGSIGAKRRAEASAASVGGTSTTPAGKGSTAAAKGPGVPTQSQGGPKRDGSGTPAGTSSVEERLQRLDSLLKKGLITKPDYDKKKAELLKEL